MMYLYETADLSRVDQCNNIFIGEDIYATSLSHAKFILSFQGRSDNVITDIIEMAPIHSGVKVSFDSLIMPTDIQLN